MYLYRKKRYKNTNSNPAAKNYQLRNSIKYKLWRKRVIERDNHECQRCGATNKRIVVHHIKGFEKYPQLRFEESNGITLCTYCHWKFHKLFGKSLFPDIRNTDYFRLAKKEIHNIVEISSTENKNKIEQEVTNGE